MDPHPELPRLRHRHKCNGSWKDYGSLLCSSCRSHEEVEEHSIELSINEMKVLYLVAKQAGENCDEDVAGVLACGHNGSEESLLTVEEMITLTSDLEACGSMIKDSEAKGLVEPVEEEDATVGWRACWVVVGAIALTVLTFGIFYSTG